MNRYSLLAIAALAVACSKQDAASDTTAVTQSGTADKPRVITVNAHDFGYTAPDTIQAGMTTFRLVNDGPGFHHLILARLDSGKTMADFDAAMKKQGPPPRWLVEAGGPNAPDPKGESNATMDLIPGNYVLFCMIDMPGGVPHLARGMVKAMTVVPATGAVAAAPVETDTITLVDYSFKLSRPLTAGQHTFRVVVDAAQPHEVELMKLEPGKTAQEVLAWMKDPKGPPPAHGVGGTLPAPRGTPVWFDANLTPGDYVLICFLPGPDGKPHFVHGMMLTQTVK